ncbi:MAG: hypothetical protein JKY54_03520 [Flavobacteriales bacterium]|nr:hypothetical protein [Flavobacteriales bacterium]
MMTSDIPAKDDYVEMWNKKLINNTASKKVYIECLLRTFAVQHNSYGGGEYIRFVRTFPCYQNVPASNRIKDVSSVFSCVFCSTDRGDSVDLFMNDYVSGQANYSSADLHSLAGHKFFVTPFISCADKLDEPILNTDGFVVAEPVADSDGEANGPAPKAKAVDRATVKSPAWSTYDEHRVMHLQTLLSILDRTLISGKPY